MLLENHSFVNSNELARNIIIVDGYSATGKKLIATYLQTFSRVQKMEVNQVFRQIANLCTFDKIDKNTAKTLLNISADTFLQNTLLSRDTNFRPYDGSSIFKTYKKFEYFKRLLLKDGDNIFNIIEEKKPILNIMTHYGLPSIDVFFNAFKERLKFISCKRHPVYSFDHWIYIVENIRKNNKRFSSLNVKDNNLNEIPWYYLKSKDFNSEVIGDILIDKLVFLEELSNSNIQKIPPQFKNSIIEIPFEKFIMNTHVYQDLISNFIEDKPTKATSKYLKKEKLPSINFSKRKEIRSGISYKVFRDETESQQDFNKRMNKIKKICSNDKFQKLIEYNINYEENFEINYFSTKEYLKIN